MRHVFFFLQFVFLVMVFIVCSPQTFAQSDPCASGGTGTCETPVSLACPNNREYLGTSATCVNLGSNPAKICCKTLSTTGTTCTGGSCRATCATGEFTDTACASTCTSSGGSYCRGCAGTGPECVGTSAACPTGQTAQAALHNKENACTDTTKET